MKTILAAVAVMAALSTSADAQMYKQRGDAHPQEKPSIGITFEKWFNICQEANTKVGNARSSSVESMKMAQFCYGLTLGAAEGSDFVIQDAKLNTICMPDGTKTVDMVNVGRTFYLKIKDPELRKTNFAAGLAWAFFDVWPCGQRS